AWVARDQEARDAAADGIDPRLVAIGAQDRAALEALRRTQARAARLVFVFIVRGGVVGGRRGRRGLLARRLGLLRGHELGDRVVDDADRDRDGHERECALVTFHRRLSAARAGDRSRRGGT